MGKNKNKKNDEAQTPSSPPLTAYFATKGEPHGLNLYVRETAKKKMDGYVRLIDSEVGWMGFIRTHKRVHQETGMQVPALLILEDVFLYEQEVSGSSIDSGIEANIDIGKILSDLTEQGKADMVPMLRFFAHSHVNMNVYHSNVDVDMINDWAATGLDWFISHVQNKKGEVNCRLDIITPFRVSCPVNEIVILDEAMESELTDEILANVRKKSYQNNWHGGSWHNNNQNRHSVNTRGSSDTWRHLPKEGQVVSEEAKNPFNPETGLTQEMGTVEKPFVRHRPMVITEASGQKRDVQVRQEVVKGVIIHESFTGSPAAAGRTQMTVAEKWGYYNEYMGKNPQLRDPTPEQLEQSRSLQRSEDKRDGTSGKEDEQPQTQDQSEAKSDSQEQPGDGNAETSQGSSDNETKTEKQQLTEEQAQESLIVIEDGGDEKKDEKNTASGIQKEVDDEMEQAGYAI